VALRYKHVEAALAEVANVRPVDIGAFRAKLRHLRNIGLPRLPSPGSGLPIAYSRRQALEMLLAMELGNIGQAPKSAALLAQSITRQAPYGQHAGKDCYVVLSEAKPGYTMAYGLSDLSKAMAIAPDIFLTINVSACVRKLDQAIDRTMAAD
jgi:hypothetical protein